MSIIIRKCLGGYSTQAQIKFIYGTEALNDALKH